MLTCDFISWARILLLMMLLDKKRWVREEQFSLAQYSLLLSWFRPTSVIIEIVIVPITTGYLGLRAICLKWRDTFAYLEHNALFISGIVDMVFIQLFYVLIYSHILIVICKLFGCAKLITNIKHLMPVLFRRFFTDLLFSYLTFYDSTIYYLEQYIILGKVLLMVCFLFNTYYIKKENKKTDCHQKKRKTMKIKLPLYSRLVRRNFLQHTHRSNCVFILLTMWYKSQDLPNSLNKYLDIT